MNTVTTMVWYDAEGNEIQRTHPTRDLPPVMQAVPGAQRMVVVYDADWHVEAEVPESVSVETYVSLNAYHNKAGTRP